MPPHSFLEIKMDLFFKFTDSCIKLTKGIIDANTAIAKKVVDYSEKPYKWFKDTVKK